MDCGFVKNWMIIKNNMEFQMKTTVENCVEIVQNPWITCVKAEKSLEFEHRRIFFSYQQNDEKGLL